jgi:phosphate transport system protein
MTGTPLTTELQELNAQMTRLGSLVENALTQVLAALEMSNRDKACAVVVGDTMIDDLHLAIQQHAFHTLIFHQPLPGRHLRYLTSLVPITNDLERIADEAEGIAQIFLRMVPYDVGKEATSGEQGGQLQQTHDEGRPTGTAGDVTPFPEHLLMRRILDLGQEVRSLLQRTMKAFTDRDTQAARSIWQEDSVVNQGHYLVSQDLLAMLEGSQAIPALQRDPSLLQQVTYMLWIAYKLERMADHCTNICESIVFLVEGETDIYATLARE